MDEGLGDGEAGVEGAEEGGAREPEVEGDGGVVGGHVEGPGWVGVSTVVERDGCQSGYLPSEMDR